MIPVFNGKFGAKYLQSLRPDPDFRHLNHAVKACGSLERKNSDTVKAQRPASQNYRANSGYPVSKEDQPEAKRHCGSKLFL